MHATGKLSDENLSSHLGLTTQLMNAYMEKHAIPAFDALPDTPT